MRRALGLILVLLLSSGPALAQSDEPVLRAGSRTIDIRDGSQTRKGLWTCDPSIPLDVYDAVRSDAPRTIEFTSDTDSIRFEVQPGRVYDFVVLLNDGQRCPTRISTLSLPARRDPAAQSPVTIPVSIRSGKLHLTGTVNGSRALDLIFDTGANINVLYPSGLAKGAALVFDGETNNSGTGGVTRRQTSSANRLSIGPLHWDHEPFLFIEKQADDADGIVGYRVFEDKAVEFDYDRMVMVIHDALPASAASFTPTALIPVGALTAVETTILTTDGPRSAPCILDTGGTGALLINQQLAADLGLHANLPVIGRSVSRGVGSGTVRNQVLLAPEVRVAGHAVKQVPIDAELPEPDRSQPPQGLLCMEVLQRFNTIIDYPAEQAYFAPNSRFAAPFPSRTAGPPLLIATAIGAALAIALGAILYRRTRTRRALRAPESAAPGGMLLL